MSTNAASRKLCRFGEITTPLIAAFLVHQHLHGLVDREAAGLLPRRELLERLQVLRHDRLCRYQDKHVIDKPSDVVAGLLFRPLERVGAQVEQLWRAQWDQWLHPDLQSVRLLFHEHRLVLIVTQPGEVAVIGPVKELAALVGALAGEKITLVVAVEMHLEALAAGVVALQELLFDVRDARRRR